VGLRKRNREVVLINSKGASAQVSSVPHDVSVCCGKTCWVSSNVWVDVWRWDHGSVSMVGLDLVEDG
jgi:hypothetical protein